MNFKALIKPLIKNDNLISWESDICFKYGYKNLGNVVIKKYKKDSICINWLNQELKQYYSFKSIMPVAQHEFRALEILSKYDIAPKPLEMGLDYIIMEQFGKSLTDNKTYYSEMLKQQARLILEKLKDIKFKHNDLLARNVLIDTNNKIKLIDFTLSEFSGINLIKKLPDENWAYPDDERLLNYFK